MSTANQSDQNFSNTWRYKLGLSLFVIGTLILICSPLMPVLGLKPVFIGVAALIGEGLSLLSIIFLGKEGFKALKNKIARSVKEGYTTPVSRGRHNFGIFLFLLNILVAYLFFVYAWIAFDTMSKEEPFPTIWGMTVEQQSSFLFWIFISGEVAFLISIYVLGAEWWGKFRNIFIWSGSDDR